MGFSPSCPRKHILSLAEGRAFQNPHCISPFAGLAKAETKRGKFQVALAIASLPGMALELCSELLGWHPFTLHRHISKKTVSFSPCSRISKR